MDHYTEAFSHYSREQKKTSSLIFTHLKKKEGKYGRLKNCAKKMSKNWGGKLSHKNDPKAAPSLFVTISRSPDDGTTTALEIRAVGRFFLAVSVSSTY